MRRLSNLVEQIGFHLAQECFWFNPAKMPMPAEWVTIHRIRVKDAVEYGLDIAKLSYGAT
jgi:site-specific DNA-methyltransferase (cytosine-N4-specific)